MRQVIHFSLNDGVVMCWCYTSIFTKWFVRCAGVIKGINVSAYLIASSMHGCLSHRRIVAPMAPRIKQTTSYQRDALSWRGAEILAPHRQPWTGQAFITTLPVPLPEVMTLPDLKVTLHMSSSILLVSTFQFCALPEPEHGHFPTELMKVKFGEIKYITFLQDLVMIHSSVFSRNVLAQF